MTRYLSCEIFTASSSLVNIYEPVSVKVSVCAMTTHPSHTGRENRIGIMWTVAVGAGGGWGRGAPQALFRGLFVCVFNSSIGPSDLQ